MKYTTSRFLFLLVVCGFACCVPKGTTVAMMGSEEGNLYGGNDSYNNSGGYLGNSGNNGMVTNSDGMMDSNGNMRSQVRSIVDNILQLNRGGGQFYNNNNDPYNNNGGYANNDYAQYGNGSNRYQQDDTGSPYQSQQRWSNGQQNGDGDHYNNGGSYQNNDIQNKNNEAVALADNREVNQRIEKAINELNTLRKSVNQRFSQIQQQKNGRDLNRSNINAKDRKTEKNSNKNMQANRHNGKSKGWTHKNKVKCNKQIFTVKNIDTCNVRTNSYLSTKGKYDSKYHAKNSNHRNYSIKSYSSKRSYSSGNGSATPGYITYKIKSYSKNADGKISTELAALDNKKHTVKGRFYFSHQKGCSGSKCG